MKKIILAIFGILFTSFLFSNKTFAVSDHVETISAGTSFSQNTPVFSNCDLTCIKQYKYLTVSIDNFNGANHQYNISAFYYYDSSNNGNMILSFRSFNAPITYSIEYIDAVPKWSNEPYFPTGATLTLSEEFGGGGSIPVPEPEPCPDPEENSQYMNVVLDSFWKYQTAFAGAVVSIIVIFLVYRLIKGVLR